MHNKETLKSMPFFEGIDELPLLDKEQEYDLLRKIQEGERAQEKLQENGAPDELYELVIQGESALDKLFLHNRRIILKEAFSNEGGGIEVEDLLQVGYEGLARAASKFDLSTGNRFITYAYYWIRQKMLRFRRANERTIRLPYNMKNEFNKIKRVEERYWAHYGRRPTIKELSDELSYPPEKIRHLLKSKRRMYSLDEDIFNDEGASVKRYALVASSEETQYEGDMNMLREKLKGALDGLDEHDRRMKEIIMRRFGLFGAKQETLKAIGDDYGLSKERIRQIEKDALSILKDRLKDLEAPYDFFS